MESLRAFAKNGFNFMNSQSNSNSEFSSDSSTFLDISNDVGFDIGMNSDINEDARLFHSLNRFITLLNDRKKYFYTNIKDLYYDEIRDTRPEIISDEILNESKYNNKKFANFLRYHLLNYLRKSQANPQNDDIAIEYRSGLTHWWDALLNLLRSDTIENNNINEKSNDLRTQNENKLSDADLDDDEFLYEKELDDLLVPNLSIDLVSVILECISRIMTNLIISSEKYEEIDLNSYSQHIFMTLQLITSKLISNSNIIKDLSNGKSRDNSQQLTFYYNYNSIIRSFLGKLQAFAFIYLPDEAEFDIQLLQMLSSNFKISKDKKSILPWKNHGIEMLHEKRKGSKKKKKNFGSKFMIIISYIQNDLTFISFYWHYWYILLKFIGKSKIENIDETTIYKLLPGSELLISYSIFHFLRNDLYKVNKFLKTIKRQNLNSNFNDSMPNSEIDSKNSSKGRNGKNQLTMNNLDSFIAKNFKSIKIWTCLETLSNSFPDEEYDQYLKLMYKLHDARQLKYIKTISAYDAAMANVIYNKMLVTIVNIFKGADFLNWDGWVSGYLNLLRTYNINSQTIAILSLFNIWDCLRDENQKELIREVIKDDEIWQNLTLDTTENLTQILFIKFLIFKISSFHDVTLQRMVLEKLECFQNTVNKLHGLLKQDDSKLLARIEEEMNSTLSGDSVLLFHVNKKFILGSVKDTHVKKKNDVLDRENWILGPLDMNCKDKYNEIVLPPEFATVAQENSIKSGIIGFKVMLVPKMGKSIDYWNKLWLKEKNGINDDDHDEQEKKLPSLPMERLNLELFKSMKVDNEITMSLIIDVNNTRTQYEKLIKFIKLFNLTMIEYYDFLNFERPNDDPVMIDFEMFK